MRKAIGYNRLEGDACCQALNRYYQALRLWVNFFQPSMKLAAKDRQGSKVYKRYDPPKTPYRRVLDCPEVPTWLKDRLQQQFQSTNPATLIEEMDKFKATLWKTDKLRFLNEATNQPELDS